MKHRVVTALSIWLCMPACFPARAVESATTTPPRRVNIVFILVDDMGWKDLGCYGSTFYETPHIDKLAQSGVRFTQAYAAAPLCSARWPDGEELYDLTKDPHERSNLAKKPKFRSQLEEMRELLKKKQRVAGSQKGRSER